MKYIAYASEIIGCIVFISTVIGFISPKSITNNGEEPNGRFSILFSGAITTIIFMALSYFFLPSNNESLVASNLLVIKSSLDEKNMSPQQSSVKEIAEQFFAVRAGAEELRSRKLKDINDTPSNGKSEGIPQASIIAHSYGQELEKLLHDELNIPIPDHLDASTKNYLLEAMRAHNEWASNTVKKGLIFSSQGNDSAELSNNIAKYSRLEASLLATALGTVNLAMTCAGPGLCKITIDK